MKKSKAIEKLFRFMNGNVNVNPSKKDTKKHIKTINELAMFFEEEIITSLRKTKKTKEKRNENSI